jgi:uncharacterized protein
MASAADSFFGSFRRALDGRDDISDADKAVLVREINEAIAREPVPTIAVIGESGVGKTTTLNALFNAGAVVGHGRPTTKQADGFNVKIADHHGNKGDIRVIDLPGLGESRARAAELAELYATQLPAADVILWVHPVADRMLEFTERKVAEIFRDGLGPQADCLVFGLNKADDMYPKNWRQHANVPSEEQLKNLQIAEQNFVKTIRGALPRRSPLRVTTYSALQFYNLPRLFALLMEAMPRKRRWVLEQRMDLADFISKADQRFIAGLQGNRSAPRAHDEVPPRDWIVSQMSEQDKSACLRRGISPEDWWRMRRGSDEH